MERRSSSRYGDRLRGGSDVSKVVALVASQVSTRVGAASASRSGGGGGGGRAGLRAPAWMKTVSPVRSRPPAAGSQPTSAALRVARRMGATGEREEAGPSPALFPIQLVKRGIASVSPPSPRRAATSDGRPSYQYSRAERGGEGSEGSGEAHPPSPPQGVKDRLDELMALLHRKQGLLDDSQAQPPAARSQATRGQRPRGPHRQPTPPGDAFAEPLPFSVHSTPASSTAAGSAATAAAPAVAEAEEETTTTPPQALLSPFVDADNDVFLEEDAALLPPPSVLRPPPQQQAAPPTPLEEAVAAARRMSASASSLASLSECSYPASCERLSGPDRSASDTARLRETIRKALREVHTSGAPQPQAVPVPPAAPPQHHHHHHHHHHQPQQHHQQHARALRNIEPFFDARPAAPSELQSGDRGSTDAALHTSLPLTPPPTTPPLTLEEASSARQAHTGVDAGAVEVAPPPALAAAPPPPPPPPPAVPEASVTAAVASLEESEAASPLPLPHGGEEESDGASASVELCEAIGAHEESDGTTTTTASTSSLSTAAQQRRQHEAQQRQLQHTLGSGSATSEPQHVHAAHASPPVSSESDGCGGDGSGGERRARGRGGGSVEELEDEAAIEYSAEAAPHVQEAAQEAEAATAASPEEQPPPSPRGEESSPPQQQQEQVEAEKVEETPAPAAPQLVEPEPSASARHQGGDTEEEVHADADTDAGPLLTCLNCAATLPAAALCVCQDCGGAASHAGPPPVMCLRCFDAIHTPHPMLRGHVRVSAAALPPPLPEAADTPEDTVIRGSMDEKERRAAAAAAEAAEAERDEREASAVIDTHFGTSLGPDDRAAAAAAGGAGGGAEASDPQVPPAPVVSIPTLMSPSGGQQGPPRPSPPPPEAAPEQPPVPEASDAPAPPAEPAASAALEAATEAILGRLLQTIGHGGGGGTGGDEEGLRQVRHGLAGLLSSGTGSRSTGGGGGGAAAEGRGRRSGRHASPTLPKPPASPESDSSSTSTFSSFPIAGHGQKTSVGASAVTGNGNGTGSILRPSLASAVATTAAAAPRAASSPRRRRRRRSSSRGADDAAATLARARASVPDSPDGVASTAPSGATDSTFEAAQQRAIRRLTLSLGRPDGSVPPEEDDDGGAGGGRRGVDVSYEEAARYVDALREASPQLKPQPAHLTSVMKGDLQLSLDQMLSAVHMLADKGHSGHGDGGSSGGAQQTTAAGRDAGSDASDAHDLQAMAEDSFDPEDEARTQHRSPRNFSLRRVAPAAVRGGGGGGGGAPSSAQTPPLPPPPPPPPQPRSPDVGQLSSVSSVLQNMAILRGGKVPPTPPMSAVSAAATGNDAPAPGRSVHAGLETHEDVPRTPPREEWKATPPTMSTLRRLRMQIEGPAGGGGGGGGAAA
eukprot:Rhum_TRINITY_DN14960_c13_g1::Rhum_TRINITY_DN14960_c13_g1_i1::g.130441::m.130441